MSRVKGLALLLAVAVCAGAAGYALNLWRMDPGGGRGAAESIMALRLADPMGQQQSLAQWRNRVLVVNFWATWCAPCREEIPMFVRLQEKYRGQGLQFVGIAIDQPDKVRSFASEFAINYPILMGGIEAVELSRQAGNRIGALPFTLVIDRDGKIAATQLGELKEVKLEAMIQPLF
jgi:thiol-disulfide isomerase/thioredoxin